MRNNRGYSILEALLALAVISLLSLPLYKLLTTQKKVVVAQETRAQAYLIGSGEMEKLKSQDYLETLLESAEYAIQAGNKAFRVVRTVKPRFADDWGVVDAYGKLLKEVRVEVFSKEKRLSVFTALFGGLAGAIPKDSLP